MKQTPIVLLIFLSLASPAVYGVDSCKTVFSTGGTRHSLQIEARLRLARAAWDQKHFSDPGQHNPNSYRYIVHTIRQGPRDALIGMKNLKMMVGEADYLLSASVVDSRRAAEPFAEKWGFILDVPPENIVAASRHDMGIFNSWKDIRQAGPEMHAHVLRELGIKSESEYQQYLFKEFGLKTPGQIADIPLDLSKGYEWLTPHNEIAIAMLGPTLRQPSVSGIFLVKGAYNEADRTGLKEFARHYDLPLVELSPSIRPTP